MSDQFEKLIEARLEAELGPVVRAARPPAASFGLTPRASSMASTRTLALVMAAVFAIGGGLIAATGATGSASPAEWRLQVKAVVTQCKTTLAPGERGIGHCVSDDAEQVATVAPVPTAVATNQPETRPTVPANPLAAPVLIKSSPKPTPVVADTKPALPAGDGTDPGDKPPPGDDGADPADPEAPQGPLPPQPYK